jgi:hypothetical protein
LHTQINFGEFIPNRNSAGIHRFETRKKKKTGQLSRSGRIRDGLAQISRRHPIGTVSVLPRGRPPRRNSDAQRKGTLATPTKRKLTGRVCGRRLWSREAETVVRRGGGSVLGACTRFGLACRETRLRFRACSSSAAPWFSGRWRRLRVAASETEGMVSKISGR